MKTKRLARLNSETRFGTAHEQKETVRLRDVMLLHVDGVSALINSLPASQAMAIAN